MKALDYSSIVLRGINSLKQPKSTFQALHQRQEQNKVIQKVPVLDVFGK